MDQHGPALELDYAQPPTRRERARVLLRPLGWLAVLAVAAAFAAPYLKQAKARLDQSGHRQTLLASCLNHTVPSGTIVFDETTDARLIRPDDTPQPTTMPRVPAAPRPPRLQPGSPFLYPRWAYQPSRAQLSKWNVLDRLDVQGWTGRIICEHGLRPSYFYTQMAMGEDWADEAFVHARRAPGESTRLVLVGFDPPDFMAGTTTPFRV